MKKVLVSLAIVGATLGLTAGSATAHVPTVSATCDGVTITMNKYPAGAVGSITLGTTVSVTIGSSGAATLSKANPDQTKAQPWSVSITSPDNIGELEQSGTIAACKAPPTTTAPPVTTVPPTTTTRPPAPPVVPPAPPRAVTAPPRTTG